MFLPHAYGGGVAAIDGELRPLPDRKGKGVWGAPFRAAAAVTTLEMMFVYTPGTPAPAAGGLGLSGVSSDPSHLDTVAITATMQAFCALKRGGGIAARKVSGPSGAFTLIQPRLAPYMIGVEVNGTAELVPALFDLVD
eukprot:gene29423-62719_t